MKHLLVARSSNTKPSKHYIEPAWKNTVTPGLEEHRHPGLDPGPIYKKAKNGYRIKPGMTLINKPGMTLFNKPGMTFLYKL
jgi:hypothetical protein